MYSTSFISQRWSVAESTCFIVLVFSYILRHCSLNSSKRMFYAFYKSKSWVSFRVFSFKYRFCSLSLLRSFSFILSWTIAFWYYNFKVASSANMESISFLFKMVSMDLSMPSCFDWIDYYLRIIGSSYFKSLMACYFISLLIWSSSEAMTSFFSSNSR